MTKKMLTIAAAALLAACSGSETASTAGDEAAPDIRLYTLDCGVVQMNDLSLFDRGGAYDGRTNRAVDTCYLIRHPDGDLLWDAGLPDAIADAPDGVVSGPFELRLAKTLKSQLAEIGVSPEDVDYLSLSHSHFDHTGNANDYAGATWLVHEAERAHMFRDEARADAQAFAAYSALENAETVTFTGDHDVFGDGSVTILSLPGHTPGHTALMVRLANEGPVLLSGDLYHLTESRERRTVPVFNTDAEATLRSMDRFEEIAAETGARVVIQHEEDDYAALPKPPAYLD